MVSLYLNTYWINRKRRLEKFVDSCVVNKTCISLTTVTEKNSFTTKLAYDVNETGNPLTSCDKRRTVFCPGKWRIFRTKRTIGADSSGKTGIFPDDNGKSERIYEAESWQIWTANFMPLLSTKTPVFVDRQYQNQLLSMKSWILVDRMQNNRNYIEFYVEPVLRYN